MRVERRAVGVATAACRDADNGPAFIARGRAHLPHQDRRAVRQARGASCPRSASCPASTSPTASSAISAAARSSWSTCAARRSQARRDAAARRPRAAGHLARSSIKKAEKIVEGRAGRRAACCAQGAGPRLLRGRRHLARARAAAHGADRLSAARDARLRRCRRARRSNSAELVHRVNPRRCRRSRWCEARRPLLAYAALVLEHIVRSMPAEGGRDLGARRARGAALFDCSTPSEQAQGRADRGRAATRTCCARARRSTARS